MRESAPQPFCLTGNQTHCDTHGFRIECAVDNHGWFFLGIFACLPISALAEVPGQRTLLNSNHDSFPRSKFLWLNGKDDPRLYHSTRCTFNTTMLRGCTVMVIPVPAREVCRIRGGLSTPLLRQKDSSQTHTRFICLAIVLTPIREGEMIELIIIHLSYAAREDGQDCFGSVETTSMIPEATFYSFLEIRKKIICRPF